MLVAVWCHTVSGDGGSSCSNTTIVVGDNDGGKYKVMVGQNCILPSRKIYLWFVNSFTNTSYPFLFILCT